MMEQTSEKQIVDNIMEQQHGDLIRLEKARQIHENALHKWQSLIALEQDADSYRTIPLPFILSKEVQSLASLADSYLLISIYCAREDVLSLRNETTDELQLEARRVATIALSLASIHKDNYGEGKCYSVLGKLAYCRENPVMAHRFYTMSIDSLEKVIKHDAAYYLLIRDVRKRLVKVERSLSRRKSMMGSFKLLSHHQSGSMTQEKEDENAITEDDLRKIFDKYADPEHDTVDSNSLSSILSDLGCYPVLKDHELKLLRTQINGSPDEAYDIDFMSFWMWWVKSEPIKKR